MSKTGAASKGLDVDGSVVGVVLFRVHPRVPTIIEEPAEGELEKGVDRMLAVVQRIVQLVFVVAVAQLVRNDGVEIGRVGGVADLGYVRRRFAAEASVEIDDAEERVRLQLAGAAAPRALVGRRAQPHDQIRRFRRQVSTVGNPQRRRPVYHLHNSNNIIILKYNKYRNK